MKVFTFLEVKNTYTNKEGSDTYKKKEGIHLNSKSGNLIYLITCEKCKKQCVVSCVGNY